MLSRTILATGERIRDKIAASKAKGMWMGGNVPLGYDVPTGTSRALVVNDAEAATVRSIFETYLELGSVHALQRRLHDLGIASKKRTTASGRIVGGKPFSRGALFHLLRNRIYLGQIVHKDAVHPGLHDAIVDTALFDAVQERLDANTRRHDAPRDGSGGCDRGAGAQLTGRIFDGDGQPMSPSFTYGRRGQVYRYYVSAPLQQGRRSDKDTGIRRVAGPALEGMVGALIIRLAPASSADPLSLPVRVEVHAQSLQLLLPVALLATLRSRIAPDETAGPDAAEPSLLRLTVPVRMRLRGGRSWILGSTGAPSRRDPVLIKALRAAHAMLDTDAAGLPVLDAAPASPYLRRLVRLAFLAPELQRAILAGRQPPGLTLERLMHMPMPDSWSEQIAVLKAEGVDGASGDTAPAH